MKVFTILGSFFVTILFVATSYYSAKTAPLLNAYSPLDDSYMFIRYADNILGGYGVVWNQGQEPTFGFSSPLYLGFITITRLFLPSNPILALQLVSWTFGVFFLWCLSKVIKTCCHSELMKQTAFVFFLIAVFTFTSGLFLYHTLSGMETTLSLLMNTFLIGAVMKLIKSPTFLKTFLVAFVGFLAYETRPEVFIYSLLFPCLAILIYIQFNIRKKFFISYLGCFFLLIMIDLVLKKFFFGSPVPLAFFVKKSGFYDGYIGHANWNAIGYLLEFLRLTFPYLAILIFMTHRKHLRIMAVFLLPVVVHFFYLFTVIQIMGNNARYYLPALPFIIFPAMITLDDFIEDADTNYATNLQWFIQRLMILVVVCVAFSNLVGDKVAGAYRIYVLEAKDRASGRIPELKSAKETNWSQAVIGMANLVSTLPSGAVVAMSEVGYPGALAPQVEIIDLAGLNDILTAQQGFSLKRLLDRKPDLIWFPHYHYTKLVSKFENSDDLKSQYDIYPNAFLYGVAIRKDSPYRQQILGKIKNEIIQKGL